MKIDIDLHVHSNASSHAYSSLEELINKAKQIGLKGFALTNHGPNMEDSPHPYHFGNLKIMPDYIDNIRFYKGIESNILNESGDIDLPKKYYKIMDVVLAGFHAATDYGHGDLNRNTEALINGIKTGYIDIIAHPGHPLYPFDYEKVIKIAKEYDVAMEINNCSFTTSRPGSLENCTTIIKLCKKHNCKISIGSDAHFSSFLGEFNKSLQLIKETNFPKDLIINISIENLEKFLKNRRIKNKAG